MVYIVKRRILSSAVYCQGPYIVKQCILSSAVYGQAPYLVKRSVLSSAVYWKAPYIVKCCMFSSPVYCQALYIVKRRILSSVKYCCVIGRSHSFPVNQLDLPWERKSWRTQENAFFQSGLSPFVFLHSICQSKSRSCIVLPGTVGGL